MSSDDSWLNNEVNRILTYLLKKGMVGVLRFMKVNYIEVHGLRREATIKIFMNPLESKIEFHERECYIFTREIYESICEKYKFEDSKLVEIEIDDSWNEVVIFNYWPVGWESFHVRDQIYQKLVEIFERIRRWYLEEPIEVLYLDKLKFASLDKFHKANKFNENNIFNITLDEV